MGEKRRRPENPRETSAASHLRHIESSGLCHQCCSQNPTYTHNLNPFLSKYMYLSGKVDKFDHDVDWVFEEKQLTTFACGVHAIHSPTHVYPCLSAHCRAHPELPPSQPGPQLPALGGSPPAQHLHCQSTSSRCPSDPSSGGKKELPQPSLCVKASLESEPG